MFRKLGKVVVYFVGGILVLSIMATACSNEDVEYQAIKEETSGTYKVQNEVQQEEIKEDESVPMEHRQALKKAQSYLRSSSFSPKDLRNQLEYHEFSNEAIEYAMANIEVDWQQECIDKAESYMKSSSFSEHDLRRQLEYHEFDQELIDVAIQQVYK